MINWEKKWYKNQYFLSQLLFNEKNVLNVYWIKIFWLVTRFRLFFYKSLRIITVFIVVRQKPPLCFCWDTKPVGTPIRGGSSKKSNCPTPLFLRHVRKARARASADTKVLTVTEHRNMNSKARNSSFPDALFAQVVDYFFCIYWNTQISQPNVVCIQYPQSNAVKTVWTKGVNLYEIDANNTFWQALQNIRKTKKPCTRSLLPLLSASEVLEICHKTYKGESK